MAPTQSTIGPLQMRWSSSACCTARATSPRSPSAEDSPNDAPEGQRGQTSLGSLPRPYLPLYPSGAVSAQTVVEEIVKALPHRGGGLQASAPNEGYQGQSPW